MKFYLDLSNYATKADLNNGTGVDTSKYAKKNVYLDDLKSRVDKLDIDKLKNEPTNSSNLKSKTDKLDADKLVAILVDLSKLNDLIKNDVVKKDMYNAYIKKIEDKLSKITNLANYWITTLNGKINEVKNKIHSISNIASNIVLNSEINEVETKITNITNLATTTIVLIAVKICNFSNVLKLTKLKIKFLLIMIMIILLLKNLVN